MATNGKETTMDATTIDTLGKEATQLAMAAFAEFARTTGFKVTDLDRAIRLLREECGARVDAALDDARDAFSCGMDDAGVATFKASMALAGIEAAKRYCCP